MAETSGLVQRLTVFPEIGATSMACAWVGPTPTNTELLFVARDDSDPTHVGAFKNSIVDALATAHLGRQEVIAQHGDGDAEITALRFEPS